MNDFNDPQDFFRRGDDGTYEGGPVQSLAEDFTDLELDSLAPVSASRQERRVRFTRLVAAIVTVLGLGSTLVFAHHALSDDASALSDGASALNENAAALSEEATSKSAAALSEEAASERAAAVSEDAASMSAAPQIRRGPDGKSDRPAAAPAVVDFEQLPAGPPVPAAAPTPAQPADPKLLPNAAASATAAWDELPGAGPAPAVAPARAKLADQKPQPAAVALSKSSGASAPRSHPWQSRRLPKRALGQVARKGPRRSAHRSATRSLSSRIKPVSTTDTANVTKRGYAPPTARFSD